MTNAVRWMGRHQVALCLGAIAAGGVIGILLPGSDVLAVAIEPVLALLLFATFLAVPFAQIGAALRDARFLALLALVNFVIVPGVVFALSRPVASNDAILIGVLLVLLTPCVDYVIVFTGLAGGARDRLLAAAPVLMVAQVVLLPLYLRLFIGPDAAAIIHAEPFARAFIVIIALPLTAAIAVQLLARRHRAARRIERGVDAVMTPLMVATLLVVVASQVRGIGARMPELLAVIPIYIAFAVIMVAVGVLVSRGARLDAPTGRALTFSGVTRNSLVVLPLALALPAQLALAPLVVVTQTLVELVVMVVLVRLLPRLLPHRTTHLSAPPVSGGVR